MKKITKISSDKPKQNAKKLRVAAYCRVSTDNDAQLESLEAQKKHYEDYISNREDWTFAGLYYHRHEERKAAGITADDCGLQSR